MQRFQASSLITFASQLLTKSGLAEDRSRVVAEILVEADLMGHTTHGLQLLAPYLKEISSGTMAVEGEPIDLAERPATFTWDGRRLPGPWLVVKAIERAIPIARIHGTATAVIRRSHHIACLAAYLERATSEGLAIILTCSDPAGASVVPHGGTRPLYTPDPLAAGWPTAGDPVLLDVSMSTTTNGLTTRLRAAGQKLDHPWLVTPDGQATNDPNVLFTDPPGGILPIGGLDLGHKGFALGLLVEALTSGLGGEGRADGVTGWGASVFLQLIDPEAFGGLDAFKRETGWLADAARATPPIQGKGPVRVPGDGALARKRRQLAEGVELFPTILPALLPFAEELDVPLPS